jgi:branched-chain amino acid aminotransferase
VKPAPEYLFVVFGVPVGPYFKGGFKPVRLVVSEYDRAAPNGTGHAKVGGNYAASMIAHQKAVKAGYADCIYLDPANHENIEEAGAANFFGITKEGVFVTPKSPSILPSITKYSLMYIAKKYLDIKVEERDIPVASLDEYAEVGACGTAAVITPIGHINWDGKEFDFGDEAGPITKKLYKTLTEIQVGDREAPEGWIVEV